MHAARAFAQQNHRRHSYPTSQPCLNCSIITIRTISTHRQGLLSQLLGLSKHISQTAHQNSIERHIMTVQTDSVTDGDFKHQTQPCHQESPELDLSALFSDLDLNPSPHRISKPTPNECLVHLKLLTTFHRLRQDIATTDGLFDIHDNIAVSISSAAETKHYADLLRKVREKRWVVYVVKAVHRFERYWAVLNRKPMLKQRDIGIEAINATVEKKLRDFGWSVDTLLPLGQYFLFPLFTLASYPDCRFLSCFQPEQEKKPITIATVPVDRLCELTVDRRAYDLARVHAKPSQLCRGLYSSSTGWLVERTFSLGGG